MKLVDEHNRPFALAAARLTFCNPFTPERIAGEREALGEAFEDAPPVWSLRPEIEGDENNLRRLVERVQPLVEQLREQLAGDAVADPDDLSLYEDLVLYLLYDHCRADFNGQIAAGEGRAGRVRCWRRFRAEFERYLRRRQG